MSENQPRMKSTLCLSLGVVLLAATALAQTTNPPGSITLTNSSPTTNRPGSAILPGAGSNTNAPASVPWNAPPSSGYTYPILNSDGVVVWPTNFAAVNGLTGGGGGTNSGGIGAINRATLNTNNGSLSVNVGSVTNPVGLPTNLFAYLQVNQAAKSSVLPRPPLIFEPFAWKGIFMAESDYLYIATNCYNWGISAMYPVIISITDGWQGTNRLADGSKGYQTNLFPHGIRWLRDAIHSNNCLVQIYDEPWQSTSAAGAEDAYGHPRGLGMGTSTNAGQYMEADIRKYVIEYGVDAVRCDVPLFLGPNHNDTVAYYAARAMAAAQCTNYPIIVTTSGYDHTYPAPYASLASHIWQASAVIGDAVPSGDIWSTNEVSLLRQSLDTVKPFKKQIGPGHYQIVNDLRNYQYYAGASVAAILASPMEPTIPYPLSGIGSDAVAWSIQTNVAFRDIHQDPLGQCGSLVSSNAQTEVWVRPLANGDSAVLAWNHQDLTDTNYYPVSFGVTNCGWPAGSTVGFLDVWNNTNGSISGSYSASLPSLGCLLFRVKAPLNNDVVASTVRAQTSLQFLPQGTSSGHENVLSATSDGTSYLKLWNGVEANLELQGLRTTNWFEFGDHMQNNGLTFKVDKSGNLTATTLAGDGAGVVNTEKSLQKDAAGHQWNGSWVAATTTNATHITVMSIGDSYSEIGTSLSYPYISALLAKYGFGGFASFSDTTVPNNLYAPITAGGAASTGASDTNWWLPYYTIPNAGSVTYGSLGSGNYNSVLNYSANKVGIWYKTGPSEGAFKVTVYNIYNTGADVGGAVATASTNGCAYLGITVSQKTKLAITSTNGTVHIFGAHITSDTGLNYVQMVGGGSALYSLMTLPQATLDTVFTNMPRPNLIFYNMKDLPAAGAYTDVQFSNSLNSLDTYFTSKFPGASVVYVGDWQTSNDVVTATSNNNTESEIIRQMCIARNRHFFDPRLYVPSYQWMTNLGYMTYASNPHLTSLGVAYLGKFFADEMRDDDVGISPIYRWRNQLGGLHSYLGVNVDKSFLNAGLIPGGGLFVRDTVQGLDGTGAASDGYVSIGYPLGAQADSGSWGAIQFGQTGELKRTNSALSGNSSETRISGPSSSGAVKIYGGGYKETIDVDSSGFWVLTNAPAPPASARQGGAMFFWNSNSTWYLLQSDPFSTAWSATNKLGK
jgi:alpha-galactosidase